MLWAHSTAKRNTFSLLSLFFAVNNNIMALNLVNVWNVLLIKHWVTIITFCGISEFSMKTHFLGCSNTHLRILETSSSLKFMAFIHQLQIHWRTFDNAHTHTQTSARKRHTKPHSRYSTMKLRVKRFKSLVKFLSYI